jgi:hypothetical protein
MPSYMADMTLYVFYVPGVKKSEMPKEGKKNTRPGPGIFQFVRK